MTDSSYEITGIDTEHLEKYWLEYWEVNGERIVLSSWLAKYGDYINSDSSKIEQECDTSIENTEENENDVGNLKYSNENNDGAYNSSEEYENAWKVLWDKNYEEEYYKKYREFCENIVSKQNSGETNTLLDDFYVESELYTCANESEDENINLESAEVEYAILNDCSELSSLGLPTSFGNQKQLVGEKKKKRRKSTQNRAEENPFRNMDVESLVQETLKKEGGKEKKIKRKVKRKKREIPEEICKNEKLMKYWKKRFTLFSRFNNGIKLDEESWFSVTPEKIAKGIAERLKCDIIVDAFCGCGGNTIQFAFKCNKVIAIDIDPKKIEYAKHNARIYGVDHKIDFIIGDFLEIYENLKADIIFLSPPWGGPDYLKNPEYDIENNLQPVPASQLLEKCRTVTPNIAIYLPKNSKVEQIVKNAGIGKSVEITKNFLNDKLVALTAFYGGLIPTDDI